MARTTKAASKASSRRSTAKATTKKAATTAARKAPAKPAAKPAAKRATKAAGAARKTAAKGTAKAPAKRSAKAPAKAAKSATKAPAKVARSATKAPAKAAATNSTRTVAAPPKLPAGIGGSARQIKKAPPKRKGPLDKFLLGQLEALQSERVTYTRQAASLRAEADLLMADREPGDVQFDEESGEGDTLAVERERDLALSAQASAAVEEIDLAVAKIREGTYGVCEQCHNTIPKERLRALPYAALCVQCKSAGFTRR